jgi:hypothetical protein
MSTNADDVIPAASLVPPSAPSSVDDIIPPHSMIATTQPGGEISDGPMGFINGVAGIAGKAALNIPYAAASGVQDLYRMATGGDEKATDSDIVDALHFPLNKNERNVSESIAGTPTVSGTVNAAKTVVNEDLPMSDSAKRITKDIAQIVPLASSGLNAFRAASTGAEAVSEMGVTAPRVFDSPPVDGGLSPELVKDRAAVLSRVGIENARNSALAGDAKSAATDFQLSKFDEPAGVAAKSQFDAEKTALQNHATGIIKDTGGTLGTDEDTLNDRGQTIAKPFDQLRSHIDNQATNLYEQGTKRLGTAPISTDNLEAALGDRTLKNELLSDGKSSFLDGVKDQLDNLKEQNGGQLNVQNAEQFRQFLNGRWSTAKYAVGKLKSALDNDVGVAVGEDVYGPARQTIQMGHQLLDDPQGISQLFDVDPKNPLNRSTAYEKIPDTLTRLPASQFDNVIRTLDTMPEQLQPQAQAAKAEIKAHLANKVLDAGSSTQGQWNAPAVSKVIKANAAKLQSAFADQPETLQKIQDLESAGKILKVDQSYPGAAAQASNVLKRGFMSGAIAKGGAVAGGSVGATAGAILAGPPGAVAGTTAGAAIGGGLGGKVSQGMAERAALKKWQSGTTKLSDIVPLK